MNKRLILEDGKHINARDLYAELSLGRDFSTWIASKVVGLGLEEGKDYTKAVVAGTGSKPRIDYTLTLEAALNILKSMRKNSIVNEIVAFLEFEISNMESIYEVEALEEDIAPSNNVEVNEAIDIKKEETETPVIAKTTSLKIFENEMFGNIRTVVLDGKSYVVGNDVAKALGYSNYSKAIRNHCRNVVKASVLTTRGNQVMNLIGKSDIFRLIASSQLDSAVKFEKWIFEEVLPDVYDNGFYATDAAIENFLSDPDSAITLLINYRDEKKRREALENQIYEIQPKVDAYDEFLESSEVYTVGAAAKMLCIPRTATSNRIIGKNTLMSWLRRDGVLMDNGDERNIPYQRFISQGYFEVKAIKDDSKQVTRITPRGIDWIYKKYKHKNMPKKVTTHYKNVLDREDLIFEEV